MCPTIGANWMMTKTVKFKQGAILVRSATRLRDPPLFPYRGPHFGTWMDNKAKVKCRVTNEAPNQVLGNELCTKFSIL